MSPTALPQFSIKQYKFKIPTLKLLSEALAKNVRIQLCTYSNKFSEILLKHLTSETEIQLVNGRLTDESLENLQLLETEMSVLQYNSNLRNILDAWTEVVLGQPVLPEVHDHLHDLRVEIHEKFETFVYELQKYATRKTHAENKQLCNKACKDRGGLSSPLANDFREKADSEAEADTEADAEAEAEREQH